MKENLRNRKTVVILSILTAITLVCCISLVKIAADKPKSPEFCARCHSMESSYNTWKETVACNTECLDCHTHDKDGKTLSVEISDSNCTSMNCHPVEKLISNTSKYSGNFTFKHETHLKEFATNLKIQCVGCHSYLGKGEQEGTQTKHFGIDENVCYVCHFTKSSAPLLADENEVEAGECTLCHQDVQANIMIYEKEFDHLKYEKDLKVGCENCHFETVHGNGGTDKESCYYCHTKIPDEYTGVDRMHNDHVKEHKVPCSPCHGMIRHEWNDEFVQFIIPARYINAQEAYSEKASDKDISKKLEGPSDNTKWGDTIFKDKPYLLQKEIYRGIRGKGPEGSPDPMYLATVRCIACHKDRNLTVDPDICNTCHEKGFDKTMMEQREFVVRKLKELSGLITESRRNGIPKYLIDEAIYNYNLIVSDGSYGVHNIKYVKDLIEHCIGLLNINQ